MCARYLIISTPSHFSPSIPQSFQHILSISFFLLLFLLLLFLFFLFYILVSPISVGLMPMVWGSFTGTLATYPPIDIPPGKMTFSPLVVITFQ